MAAALSAIVFALLLWIVPVSTLRTGASFDFVGAISFGIGLAAAVALAGGILALFLPRRETLWSTATA